VLLGNNATAKSYIETPLSVDDALSLLKDIANRINLVKYMADYDLIQSGISESSVIELTDSNDVKFTNQVIKNYDISNERLKSYGVVHSQHKFKDEPDNVGNRRVEVKYIK
jgi:hypothetical protein